jgi:hypothetical protein
MIIACFAVSWAIVMIQEIRNIRNISRAITTSILIAVISIPAALGSSIGFTGDSALRASTILAGLIATSIGAVGLRTRVDQ